MKRIYNKELPISAKTYAILEDIMLEEDASGYKIYSKTGAATKDWKGYGWYIGYLTKYNGEVWFFVTNILINNIDDLPKRKSITMEILKDKGVV